MDIKLGKLIIFEGSDNCGKTTQAQRVAQEFQKFMFDTRDRIVTCTHISFPQYETVHGDMIKHMLYHPDQYNLTSKKDAKLFGYIQYQDKLNALPVLYDLLGRFDFVFCDRYTLSGRIHDAALYFDEFLQEYDDTYEVTPEAYHREVGLLAYNKEKLAKFVTKYVFGLRYLHEIERNRTITWLNMLEHRLFDIAHVYMKSSKIISTITSLHRELDQHEIPSDHNVLIRTLFDSIPEVFSSTNQVDLPSIGPQFTDRFMHVDSDSLIVPLLDDYYHSSVNEIVTGIKAGTSMITTIPDKNEECLNAVTQEIMRGVSSLCIYS
jgi:hypothetical protein